MHMTTVKKMQSSNLFMLNSYIISKIFNMFCFYRPFKKKKSAKLMLSIKRNCTKRRNKKKTQNKWNN